MPASIGPYDQYILACIVIAGTAFAVLLLLWTTQRSPYAAQLRTFHGVAQNFLTVINVIFALNLAFLANDTWNAHDRALNAVFQEAGNLRNIVDLSADLPPAERSAVLNAVQRYAGLTVAVEWPLLGRRDSNGETSQALDALIRHLASAEVAALSSAAQAQMLNQATQVRMLRDQRIALSRTHVNPLKWLGMAFLGFLTMISIAIVHIEHPRAEILAVVLFATAAAPTAAIILIHGNPFQEPMAISSAPIAAVLDDLNHPPG